MHDVPILRQRGEAGIDARAFVEGLPAFVERVRADAVDGVMLAQGGGVFVLGVGDDDQAVEMARIGEQEPGEEIGIVNADGDGLRFSCWQGLGRRKRR